MYTYVSTQVSTLKKIVQQGLALGGRTDDRSQDRERSTRIGEGQLLVSDRLGVEQGRDFDVVLGI